MLNSNATLTVGKLGSMGVFFARPSHPWERGTNENTIGFIRQFILKRTKIAEISHKRLKVQIQDQRVYIELIPKTPIFENSLFSAGIDL